MNNKKLQQSFEVLSQLKSALNEILLTQARLTIVIPVIEVKILAAQQLHHIVDLYDETVLRLLVLSDGPYTSQDKGGKGVFDATSLSDMAVEESVTWLYQTVFIDLARHFRGCVSQVDAVLDRPTYQVLDRASKELLYQSEQMVDLLNQRLGPYSSIHQLIQVSSSGVFGSVSHAPTSPARDLRFAEDADYKYPLLDSSDLEKYVLQLSHTALMNLEIATLECCSRIIIEFFNSMPIEFIKDISRQCWDEARHAEAFKNRISSLGGGLGMFPSKLDLWNLSTDQSLAIRLTAHQKVGEWIGVDAAIEHARLLTEKGDIESSNILEFIVMEEITHVEIGVKWTKYICENDENRINQILQEALDLRERFDVKPGNQYPFNLWPCERAGVDPTDVNILMRRLSIESP